MALYYVYSGAGGTGDGSSWVNAFTTLAGAFSGKAAGDSFAVADDHAETQASAMTLTSPGTAASPCKIYCAVRVGGSTPPVSADLRTTATISTTGASAMSYAGYAHVRGVTFTSGSGSSGASMNITSTSAWGWRFDSCKLKLGNTNAASILNIGASTANAIGCYAEFNNTTCEFGATGQGMKVRVPFAWRGGTVAGTMPTTLFLAPASNLSSIARIIGVDLSPLGSSNIVTAGTDNARYFFLDCKLGTSFVLTTGTFPGPGGTEAIFVNCDSGNTNYKYAKVNYQGTEGHEATIVRSGGATDGTTTISRKIVTTANANWMFPYESEWFVVWGDTTGGAVTVSIPMVNDGVTLTTADVWPEVEALTTSGFPLGTLTSGGTADILAAGSNWATDGTSSWTTTGLASPVKQTLSVSFTPALKGPYRVRIKVAKASQTLYVDPLAIAGRRQYMIGEGGYLNELTAAAGGSGVTAARIRTGM